MASGRRGSGRKFSVTRLRRWLLGGTVALLVVLGGLLGYARYRARRMIADLPRRLGVDIKSETNGFTYSQSVKGRTLFTIHAAKAIQRENGKTTLHDVAITLYGPVGSHRIDSIRGAEFEYDQPNGVVRAMGEVHLDLASPAANEQKSKEAEEKRIAVTTSGLVFLQRLGVAATDEPIHFLYQGMTGDARGADYESDTGMLRLRQDVHLQGDQDGHPTSLTASAVEIDRVAHTALLHGAHIHSDTSDGIANMVVLTMGKSGDIESVRAQGDVRLQTAHETKASSQSMTASLNESGKLQSARLLGDVKLHNTSGEGTSAEAVLHFDHAGAPQRVELLRSVALKQHRTGTVEPGTLTADNVVVDLAQDSTQHTQLQAATATGHAQLRTVGANRRVTVVRAAMLHASTAQQGTARYVAQVDGSGNTRVDETGADGSTRSSTGDTLQAALQPAVKGRSVLQRAVQTGHVVITQHTPATTGPQATAASDSRATAARAELEGSTQRLLLTGSPVVTSDGLQMAAERIALVQTTGEAEAQGGVKGTLAQAKDATDPVHVMADRGTVSGGDAKFYGGAKPAQLWSSSGQLDAPVIEIERKSGKLLAHGAAGLRGAVHLSLASAGARSGVTKIDGSTLVYTPAEGSHAAHADLTGGVTLNSAGSQMSSDALVATLRNEPAAVGTVPLLGGSLQTMDATGRVRIQQPGRIGTGERLVYTVATQQYVLTGTTAAPPRIADSLRGTVTGASLIFHGGDDSVEVAGEPGHRVRTETQAGRTARSR